MSLGQLPLLTRGSFALLYGGENIIDQLSVISPGDYLYDTHWTGEAESARSVVTDSATLIRSRGVRSFCQRIYFVAIYTLLIFSGEE